jgi:hypothetical protein
LNATNDALQPSAGGIVEFWSDPIEGEIRDDQGISLHNPDTDVFMDYTLAGAYDSNIALLLTVGDSSEAAYEQMAEVLRATRLRGKDLQYQSGDFTTGWCTGSWAHGQCAAHHPVYRALFNRSGRAGAGIGSVDVDIAWQAYSVQAQNRQGRVSSEPALSAVLARKQSVAYTSLKLLMSSPHLLAGWLSLNQRRSALKRSILSWAENPVEVLADTYHFLRWTGMTQLPAANMIWDHDHAILSDAEDFYAEISRRLG